MTKTIDESPSISDTILFTLTTTDTDGDLSDPDTIDTVSIFYIQRSFFHGNYRDNLIEETEADYNNYYNNAILTQKFGDDDTVAWDSSTPDESVLTHVTEDEDSNPVYGTFTLSWQPNNREGDYFICWVWTLDGNQQSNYYRFFVSGDTKETTSIPIHQTDPEKYTTLFDRYMPEFIKTTLIDDDLTPDVIARYNTAIAKMFTDTENLSNQIIDLIDANVTPEKVLPYLAGLFKLKLASNDSVLWRKQIKQAIPLYKQKGTLAGLTTALSNADIELNSFEMLWQVVSTSTWQEGLAVTEDSQTIFTLSKLAVLPTEAFNFELYIRPNDEDDYEQLTFGNYITLSNSGGVTTATWIGESAITPIILITGDILKIVYKIAEPDDQDVEDYIRTLPLADQRDEVDVTYPLKNWNVRLISESDSMFNIICDVKHPFVEPLVFGKVRTEFPYSENVYNMDEYNGSSRDSTDICDIDKSFLDSCSCCQSSKFNIDLTIDDLSDDRISEASNIIETFKPFHLQMQSMSYSGKVEDIMIPPTEDVTVYIQYSPSDNFMLGVQNLFNRHMPLSGGLDSSYNALLRNELASPTTVASSVTGTGKNDDFILYAPQINFGSLGVNTSNNLLEILSGTSAGEYTTDIEGNYLVINQGTPDTLPYPLESGEHTFRLSNIVYEDLSSSIYEDHLVKFSDSNVDFTQYEILGSDESGSPWKVVISNGSNPGTYTIKSFLPDNSFFINGWPGNNQTSLSYQLQTNASVVMAASTTGKITVTHRGRVEVSDDVQTGFGVVIGYYILYASNQYLVSGFNSGTKMYIDDYDSGDVVGVASIKVLKRLVDSDLGFLDTKGMYIVSGIDYESSLGIVNGNDQSIDGVQDTDSKFKENYLILIGSNYYTIDTWIGTSIHINGYKLAWGLSGTSVVYSIISYTKTSPITVGGYEFIKLDRDGKEIITITTETVGSMAMASVPNGVLYDTIGQNESIKITIEEV